MDSCLRAPSSKSKGWDHTIVTLNRASTCFLHCNAQNLDMSTCCGNRHTVTYGCVVITCQTTGGCYSNVASSQAALTFTTVRIPSLVTGSVSILKCPPSSPCMMYLALHAALCRLSLSFTCTRRGEMPLSCSFTLPEPYCMNPGCRGKRTNCRILFIVLYTVISRASLQNIVSAF